MAQLRHEYAQFRSLNTEILVVAPNRPASLARYMRANPTPFLLLSDPGAGVAARYGIEALHIPFFTMFIGALFVVDRGGRVRYANYEAPLVARPDESAALGVLTGMAE